MHHCAYCGRVVLFTAEACRRCAASAVGSDAEGQTVLRAAQAWLRTEGLNFGQSSLPLRLRDAHEVGNVWGLTKVQWIGIPGVWRRVTVQEIAVLRGLPRLVFASVCVHELGHAWIADRQVVHLSHVEEEGFCELLQARWLAGLRSPEARRQLAGIQRNSDSVYGAGFRMMCARAALLGGFPRLVAHLRARATADAPVLNDWQRKVRERLP